MMNVSWWIKHGMCRLNTGVCHPVPSYAMNKVVQVWYQSYKKQGSYIMACLKQISNGRIKSKIVLCTWLIMKIKSVSDTVCLFHWTSWKLSPCFWNFSWNVSAKKYTSWYLSFRCNVHCISFVSVNAHSDQRESLFENLSELWPYILSVVWENGVSGNVASKI